MQTEWTNLESRLTIPYSTSNGNCVASCISCERWNDAIRQLDERLIDCIECALRAAVSFKLFICRNQFSPFLFQTHRKPTETIYSIHFFDLFDDSLVFQTRLAIIFTFWQQIQTVRLNHITFFRRFRPFSHREISGHNSRTVRERDRERERERDGTQIAN